MLRTGLRRRSRKRSVGGALALSASLVLATGGTAQARHHAKRCETFTLSTNAKATVCAFVDAHDFRVSYRGVGTVRIDRGTADIAITSVVLYRDDSVAREAGSKRAEDDSLEQSTGWDRTEFGRYRVRMGYTVGIKGGEYRSAAIDSGVHEPQPASAGTRRPVVGRRS